MNQGDFKINSIQQAAVIEMAAVITEDWAYKMLPDVELDSINI